MWTITARVDRLLWQRRKTPKALETLRQEHIFPDGTSCGFDDSFNIEENKFAIYDVDGDGTEELIILYTDTYSAGMVGLVLSYDSAGENLVTELMEFPALTFYDNGIIKAEWSHNQGFAGDFWPYNLYQYVAESDSYILVGSVDAWDKEIAAEDGEQNQFPDDIDSSGTGVVYYIMTNGEYDNTNPVDVSDYEQWLNTCLGSASECQVDYWNLTEVNIRQIGK